MVATATYLSVEGGWSALTDIHCPQVLAEQAEVAAMGVAASATAGPAGAPCPLAPWTSAAACLLGPPGLRRLLRATQGVSGPCQCPRVRACQLLTHLLPRGCPRAAADALVSSGTAVEGSGGASIAALTDAVLANATASNEFGATALTFTPVDSQQGAQRNTSPSIAPPVQPASSHWQASFRLPAERLPASAGLCAVPC